MTVAWSEQGHLDTTDGRIAYYVAGTGPRTVLALHGGPGCPSSYIHSMADLAGNDLRVVFYDQLGSGGSDKPGDPALLTVERFVREAEEVRRGLELGTVDV